MDDLIRFDEDWHVNTTFSGGAASVEENVYAAEARGLRSLCLVDRVRRSTGWVHDLVDKCSVADRESAIEVSCGVEVEVLDTNGTLDAPSSARWVDRTFVVADRLPTPAGPIDPEAARTQIATGELLSAKVIEWLARAYANATRRSGAVVLARPFSILPRLGVDPEGIHPAYVRWLASVMLENEACSELNELWRAPSILVLDCLLTAGVTVLPASGARGAQAVGNFEWCPRAVDGVSSLARVA